MLLNISKEFNLTGSSKTHGDPGGVNVDTINFIAAMERVASIKWQHQQSLNESSPKSFNKKF